MHRRAVRLGVLALLLAVGTAAAVLIWDGDTRVRSLDERRRTLDAVLDDVMPAVADVAAAQQAYADYGLRDEATFARVGERLEQIRGDAARLRSSDRSGDATAHLEEAWASLAALTAARTQAGEHLAAGEPLRSADLLLGSSSRQQTAMLANALRGFQAAEWQGMEVERDRLTRRAHAALAGVAVVWIVGLVALARSPRAAAAPVMATSPLPAEVPAGMEGLRLRDDMPAAAPRAAAPREDAEGDLPGGNVDGPARQRTREGAARADAPPHAGGPESPGIDLQEAATLCDAIARLSNTRSLTGILARASRLLDARGVIIWMGAGEELFAAASSGYDAAVLERLRPIPRFADNATATTWRTGQPRTVAADESSLGAIVAPMCGPAGCLGVLAAEVRNGREADAATRAVAAILAAQLAGVLAAWPAASTSEAEPRTPRPAAPLR